MASRQEEALKQSGLNKKDRQNIKRRTGATVREKSNKSNESTRFSGDEPLLDEKKLEFDDAHDEIQKRWPKKSKEEWEVGNCADVKACNDVLKRAPKGTKLDDLEGSAIKGKTLEPKKRCDNCLDTTDGADWPSDDGL